MHSGDLCCHEVTLLSMSLLPPFFSSNSYIDPYQRPDYFYPQHLVPTHQTRDTRSGTGSSLVAAASGRTFLG